MRAVLRGLSARAIRSGPQLVLGLFVAAWALVFFRLGALRQDRFATFGFDLGIYDQATWLLAHGRSFMTMRGLDVFGHHGTFVLYVFAPFYWLGGGTRSLLAAQITSQVCGAVALYLLARDIIPSRLARWAGSGLAIVYLLHPTSGWLVWEYFHPDAFAIGPMLLAYWAARTKRWPLFWVNAAIALACKEDVALSLALLGVVLVVRGERRRGAGVAVGATGWYLFVTKLLLPWRSAYGAFYEQSFFPSELGSSTFAVAFHLLRHPGTAWKLMSDRGDRSYYWKLIAPVAVVIPFLAPDALLIGVPMVIVNVISVNSFTEDYRFHYSSLPLVAVSLATVEAVALAARHTRRNREAVTAGLVGALVVTALVTFHLWGIGPGARQYDDGFWPIHHGESIVDVLRGVNANADATDAARRAALRSVPGGASVTATYNLDAHLSHRPDIYEWPNPWIPTNWGDKNEHQRDPAGVEYLAVDRALLGSPGARDTNQQNQAELLAHLLSGEFRIVYDREGVLVARRVAAPACFRASAALAGSLGSHYRIGPQAIVEPPSTANVCPVR